MIQSIVMEDCQGVDENKRELVIKRGCMGPLSCEYHPKTHRRTKIFIHFLTTDGWKRFTLQREVDARPVKTKYHIPVWIDNDILRPTYKRKTFIKEELLNIFQTQVDRYEFLELMHMLEHLTPGDVVPYDLYNLCNHAFSQWVQKQYYDAYILLYCQVKRFFLDFEQDPEYDIINEEEKEWIGHVKRGIAHNYQY